MVKFIGGIVGPLLLAAGTLYFMFGKFVFSPEFNAGLMIAGAVLLAFYVGTRGETR